MSGEATTLTKKSTMKVAVSTAKAPRYVKGRRDFFKYRELGVTEGTGGRMRAQVTSASKGLSRPTGWHRHICEMQFVYMLSGWLEIDFEDGGLVRLAACDSVMVPRGSAPNETRTSESFELLEVSVPADMGTEPGDPPA